MHTAWKRSPGGVCVWSPRSLLGPVSAGEPLSGRLPQTAVQKYRDIKGGAATLKEGPLPVAAASAQALPAGLPQHRPLTFQLLPEFLLDEPPQGVQGWRLPLGGREVGVSCLPSTSCHPRPSRAQETKGVMGNTHCILLV